MADSDVYRTILKAGTVITTSGVSDPIQLENDVDANTLDVVANISAVSGTTPAITFTIQRDNSTPPGVSPPTAWTAGTASAALIAAGRTVVSAPSAINPATGTSPRFYRVSWTVTGTTPSLTLGLYGE